MHTGFDRDDDEKGQKEVERREIEGKLVQILMETEREYKNDKHGARAEAKNFLDYVNRRAGLLIEHGQGLYRFLHLTFQEIFTALYWYELDLAKDELWDQVFKPKIIEDHYREPLLLLLAMLADGGGKRRVEFVLQQCRQTYWQRLDLDPGTISRTMTIESDKLLERWNAVNNYGDKKYL
ncbi:MAG: hypothetical protein GY869_23575, partial [Planctomycetes bacterium]|nr:hypothetical protein [Planctomycetota bacterium]